MNRRQGSPLEKRFPFRAFAAILAGVVVLLALYVTSFQSYLLFHTLVELLTIVVAGAVFIIVWNSRRFMTDGYLTFLGIAYLFVAAIDLIHTLVYKGMGILPQFGVNTPTQLWIAARALQSVSLLIAPLFLSRKLRYEQVILIFFGVCALLIASIFVWDVFPVCYTDGVGLTAFKKLAEYAISLLFAGGWLLLWRNRARFDKGVFAWLSFSVLLAVGAELAFTFYISVYGLSNLIGHVLKLMSFYALYKAIVETGLRKPYNLLFKELRESEQAFAMERDFAEALIDTAQAIIMVLDTKGKIVRINRYLEELSGYRLEEVQGKDWITTFIPQRDHARIRQLLSGAVTAMPTRDSINPIVKRDGEECQIEWSDKVLRDKTDAIVGLVSIGTNVTQRLRAETALAESEERFRDLVEHAHDLIQSVDPDGRFRYVNNAWLKTLGYKKSEIDSLTLLDVLHPDSREHCMQVFRSVLAGKAADHVEAEFISKGGDRIPVEGSVSCRFKEGQPFSTRAVFRDVTEQLQHQAELARMARRDPLTGVLNRYALKELLEREASRSARYAHSIGFLMIDVNRFKEVNDRFTHAMGDKVLQAIATLIQDNIRDADILIRYGGDEFLVILPETNGETELVKDRIQAAVDRRNESNPLLDFPVTLAIGSYHWSSESDTSIEEALAEADRLMYRDKRK